MALTLCNISQQEFLPTTTDGFQIFGPTHTEDSHGRHKKKILILQPEQKRYTFVSREWIQAKCDQAQNNHDRQIYEKAKHEYDWAREMVPDWGKVYRNPRFAIPLDLRDPKLKRPYLKLVPTRSVHDTPAP